MEELKDYAYPCMMAEKALKDVHYAMLKRDVDEASRQCLNALKWMSKLMENIDASRK